MQLSLLLLPRETVGESLPGRRATQTIARNQERQQNPIQKERREIDEKRWNKEKMVTILSLKGELGCHGSGTASIEAGH